MEIIPAIDIIEGKCVRLSRGDYSTSKVYQSDPLETAKRFEGWGLRRLHLVDLDGAKAERIINYRILEKIASETSLVIDFGGGLKSDSDLRIAFNSGATMITGGSIAVRNPDTFLAWLLAWGNERIILGADHRNGKIATSGWMQDSDIELLPFVQDYVGKGIKYVISTDINLDGMLSGTSNSIYTALKQNIPGLDLIASGGVAGMADLFALKELQLSGCIVGKAFYEGKILESDVKNYLLNV